MKPHPRIRKTIKWGGAAVTVLLVVVWIASVWWCFERAIGRWDIAVYRGTFSVLHLDSDSAGFWEILLQGAPMLSMPKWGQFSAGGATAEWYLSLPCWIPISLLLVASALAFRLDALARRRARLGLCPKCHYDRTGLAANAVCPECGAPSPSPSASLPSRPEASS